ncbi:MAG: hypothetical protein MUO77_14665, partial [Anaerolineales bacterium]|nr:hypothetical protein [Anaerolineales bacterium]
MKSQQPKQKANRGKPEAKTSTITTDTPHLDLAQQLKIQHPKLKGAEFAKALEELLFNNVI